MKKFTREYAEKLAEGNLIQQPDLFNRRKIFSNGYMKAIEETNAPELLEALKELSLAVEFLTSVDTRTAVANKNARVLLNAINKATL
mgnify:CR=1 FL=1